MNYVWRYPSIVLVSMLWCYVSIPEGFVADTLVLTAVGHKPIQDVSIGDELVVRDANGDMVLEPVYSVSVHEVPHVIRLEFDDDFIEMAEDQLMSSQDGWMEASQIVPGSQVLSGSYDIRTVTACTVVEKPTTVYGISLAHHHTYFVGQHAILVHNEAITLTCVAAETVFLANPVVAGACAVGFVGYGVWCMMRGGKKSKHRCTSEDHQNGGGGGGPNKPNGGNGDSVVAGGLTAFLTSLDESKEKVIEVCHQAHEWLRTSKGLATIDHCFRHNGEHNFAPLFMRMGGETSLTRFQLVVDVTKKLIEMGSKLPIDARGVFEEVLVPYEGELITVQGRVIDGIYKVSTMFIQPQHVR